MTIQQKLYTVKEFYEIGDSLDPDKHYELVEGEIVEMPPPNRINSFIAGLILTALNVFIQQNRIDGYAFGADGGFALTDNDVRIPDVSFIYAERMPEISDMEAIIAPDIAVEVISPGETPRKVNAKTTLYLNTGTQLVWNVYPAEKVVEVWTKGAGEKLEMQAFTTDDTLNGGDVLPEFTLPVKDIFLRIEGESQ